MVDNKNRIQFLDGLRGVAITFVILYHAYVRWSALVPFGNAFKNVPLFAFGWLGVELFFIISGFVILMTLEKCASFPDFMLRRWLRLFPAMLACSALVYITIPLFPERPGGHPEWFNLLPGMTFIDGPLLWNKLLGHPVWSLEGTFWSLFVEVKFYILFGVLYFCVNRFAAIGFIIFLSMVAKAAISSVAIAHFPKEAAILTEAMNLMGAPYFGWFAAGAIFYQYFLARRRQWLILAVIMSIWAAVTTAGLNWPLMPALIVGAVFTASILLPKAQAILSNRPLLFIGFISYPLYLLHENMMIAMIIKIGRWTPWMPSLLMPFAPIAIVIALSWIVASYVEPAIRGTLHPHYSLFRRVLGMSY